MLRPKVKSLTPLASVGRLLPPLYHRPCQKKKMIMLKGKQVINFSENATLFYLASSKLGAADAAPYACPEDEKCSTKRPSEVKKTALVDVKRSPIVHNKEQTQSSGYGDARKAAGGFPIGTHVQPSLVYFSPLQSSMEPHNNISSHPDDGSMPANYVVVSSLDTVQSSKSLAGEDIDAGVSTLSLSPNFKNDRFSATSGSDLQVMPVSRVDPARSISSPKSSTWILDQESSREAVAGSFTSKDIPPKLNPSSDDGHLESKTERSTPRKAKKKISNVLAHGCNHDQGRRMHRDSNQLLAEASPNSNSEGKTVASHVNKLRSQGKFKLKEGFTSMPVNPVELVSSKLKELQWSSGAGLALDGLRCRLNPFQANQVLKQLQDHSLALGFFNWLKSQRWFAHDQHTYTTMIGILGQARQFDSAMLLLEEMGKNGCHPNVVTYNRLINGYGRANYLNEAMKMFYQMQIEGCEPDRVTFSTLMDVHAKAGYLEVAMDLYRQMLQVGLSPDTFTYTVMIDCLGKAGYLVAAYNLFCEMIANGCTPNLVTYNIMIKMQAKARNYHSALRLYRSMRDSGFRPDKVTYGIVMGILGHCGCLEEVEAVFAEMKRDCVPDEPVYGLLVDLWGKAENPDKARAWYQAMLVDAGVKPNVPTCNSLLGAFLRVERFSDAHGVLQNMLEMGLEPSLQTYTLLLSCCTEVQANLKPCSELMAITGHPAHSFLRSLPNAEAGGANVRNHVSAFLDTMHCKDRESKRGFVDAVVDFLHKSGPKEEAGWVWDAAASSNLYPDAVREKCPDCWLINLHVMSDGTAVTALSRSLSWLRKQMVGTRRGPERVDIVTGWGRRSKVTGASSVRQAVSHLLRVFEFPFYEENGNSGCFVGYGISLRAWLLQSRVERMHLL